MEQFIETLQVRWSDLDPNFHLRHSVYYDWGAMCRLDFLNKYGLTPSVMMKHQFGPIILREECIFKREIQLGDNITINLKLIKAKRDYSRWSFQHTIMKNGDTVSAILTVDGAWMDTVKRKMTAPPPDAANVFERIEQGENFEWLD
jgi:acyl-CoA thioester hydrolase